MSYIAFQEETSKYQIRDSKEELQQLVNRSRSKYFLQDYDVHVLHMDHFVDAFCKYKSAYENLTSKY